MGNETFYWNSLNCPFFKEFIHAFILFYVFFGNNDILNCVLSYLVTRCFTYVCIYVILLMFFCWCLKGKYAEALCDAKAGRQLDPTYLKAIDTGKSLSLLFSYETNRGSWVSGNRQSFAFLALPSTLSQRKFISVHFKMARKVTVSKFNWGCESLLGCLQLGIVMACNPMFLAVKFELIDLFRLGGLFSHYRPCDDTLKNSCFQILR